MCQTGGYRKFGYFKLWVTSDENWVRSDGWLKKKKKNSPLIPHTIETKV